MKYFIIPQSDIKQIEEARKLFWFLVEEGKILPGDSCGITEKMWRLTHTRYKEYTDEN